MLRQAKVKQDHVLKDVSAKVSCATCCTCALACLGADVILLTCGANSDLPVLV